MHVILAWLQIPVKKSQTGSIIKEMSRMAFTTAKAFPNNFS